MFFFFKNINSLLRKNKWLLCGFFFCSNSINAQLTVNSSVTAQQLVNSLVGGGVAVMNVTYTGSPASEGTFSAAATNLGLSSGLILSTGNVIDAIGPNIGIGTGTDLSLPGDPTLDTLSGMITQDATVLEFDFIPQNDTISFRYVFASEEYPEYVCSQFNDAFAFLISGPGISGVANMAIIPGTTTAVTINTINSGTIGTMGSAGPACILGYSGYYVDNTNGTTIEYDGFTQLLTAQAVVAPCQMYHLKIVIADAGDGNYDSGVFLEAGSLYSTPNLNAGADQSFCSGGVANLGSLPFAGWNYSWSPSTGLSDTTISNPQVTLSNNGTTPLIYSYVATGANSTCTLSDTVYVTVNPFPTTQFSITSACSGQTSTVTYSGSAGPAATYNWNFPGATILSGSGQGPLEVVYGSPGDYTPALGVSENGCASAPSVTNIHISFQPVASINFVPDVCTGDSLLISFNGIADSITQYQWQIAGTGIAAANAPGPFSVIWNTPDSFAVTLIVTDNFCADTVTKKVSVDPPPVPDFSYVPACLGEKITIDNNTVYPDGINGSSFWFFGDGQSSMMDAPQHLYSGSGTYAVQLVSTSSKGCRDSITKSITVLPLPSVNFVPFYPSGCVPLIVQFNDSTVSPDDAIVSWTWTYSDGYTDNISNPSHTFTEPGTYSVGLGVKSALGCTADTFFSELINVYALPVAAFESSPSAADVILPNVNFTDKSALVNQWFWNFGDSTYSQDQNPNHIYNTAGTFMATLVVESRNGCRDTTMKEILISEDYSFYVPDAFTPNGDGINDVFAAKGTGILDFYLEIFDRWGKNIFTTDDMITGWDGKTRSGKPLADVYVYRIRVKTVTNETRWIDGHVTVLN